MAQMTGEPGPDDARNEMQAGAALWSIGDWSNEDVVEAACRALVAGLDSPTLRQLAGVFHDDAHWEVRLLLPAALEELGLNFYEPESPEGKVAALGVMARYCVSGTMSPRQLAQWAHRAIGHGQQPEIEQFVVFDDVYDVVESGTAKETVEDIDQRVLEACQTLIRW